VSAVVVAAAAAGGGGGGGGGVMIICDDLISSPLGTECQGQLQILIISYIE